VSEAVVMLVLDFGVAITKARNYLARTS
jgi:hypothetical protein